MKDFVHLHVHTQYSILDGQASIPKLVDKALKDGMRGMAITDHGNMMGIKEFFNYVNKVKGKAKGKLAECEEKLANATPEERPWRRKRQYSHSSQYSGARCTSHATRRPT